MKKPAKRPAHLTKAFKKGLEHSNSRAPGIRREICLSYRNTGAIDFEKARGYDIKMVRKCGLSCCCDAGCMDDVPAGALPYR